FPERLVPMDRSADAAICRLRAGLRSMIGSPPDMTGTPDAAGSLDGRVVGCLEGGALDRRGVPARGFLRAMVHGGARQPRILHTRSRPDVESDSLSLRRRRSAPDSRWRGGWKGTRAWRRRRRAVAAQ